MHPQNILIMPNASHTTSNSQYQHQSAFQTQNILQIQTKTVVKKDKKSL